MDNETAERLEGCKKAPAGWACTRERDHEGPCAAVADRDDYVAWLRFRRCKGERPSSLTVCGPDDDGAFKVYRENALAAARREGSAEERERAGKIIDYFHAEGAFVDESAYESLIRALEVKS